MLPRLVIAVLSLLAASSRLCASPDASSTSGAEEVERLIARGSNGRRPVLWFSTDPDRNLGTGPALFAANSGGRLEGRGPDPWGRARSAFGPLANAPGGVAVAGSTAHGIFSPQEGTVLFFFRPEAPGGEPMMLFSRGDWGGDNFFSLRIQPTSYGHGLMLALSDPRLARRARQIDLASVDFGRWSFAAVSWRRQGEELSLRHWVGSLHSGELTEGAQSMPATPATRETLLIGGRRVREEATLPKLVFAGGLFAHFCVYDAALDDDTVKTLFLAASRR